ncbi:hypothetical protein G7077_08385 [Sphingomonas piscis]|uniref:Uncharacterized protein n=1 Tax=Sphingomonas piscis TaxID=2714943 RepID=A0A6G7YQ99_9SPHN|nr:hypothetical protein [Sphingomonas piscis]QIK78911.1 hypothetical protein G7077_08385 [Sphingomonas piscis]
MDEGLWTSVTIVGAAILGIVMLWVVLKNRKATRGPSNDRAEAATHNLYEQEEQRRREGTDGL